MLEEIDSSPKEIFVSIKYISMNIFIRETKTKSLYYLKTRIRMVYLG